MSKTTNRETTLSHGRSIEHRLERLLDTSLLPRLIPSLPSEALHQLIRHRGLDACGEIVSAATPAQLTSLLDLDLWRHPHAGRDDQFDVDRFGEWLEVLVDSGGPQAARTFAAFDKELVIVGLSRYVRVFDPGIFEPTAQSDDEPMDRDEAMPEGDASGAESSGAGLECEVAGYRIRARRADAWDAIVTLLVALDDENPHYFHDVMQGCRRLSNSRPELDGLDDLLMAQEQQLHDVAVERERRRSQQGYATPGDARAFLEMARHSTQARPEASAGARMVNPIVRAYFQAADDTPLSSAEAAQSLGTRRLTRGASTSQTASAPPAASRVIDDGAAVAEVAESIAAVMELLTEAGVMPKRPHALLEPADGQSPAGRPTPLRRLMAYLHDRDEAAYFTRSRELAFLANTLLAGCSVQSRPFTPAEASDAAAGVCNLGLEYWTLRRPGGTWRPASSKRSPLAGVQARSVRSDRPGAPPDAYPPDTWLKDHDLVSVFEVGWSVLHEEVSLFAASQLISTLTALRCADRELQRELAALKRTLMTQRATHTPWNARHALETLAMLDPLAWNGVLGLFSECPVVPAALRAVVERRTTPVDPASFDFISTAAQIDDVRIFMRKLPDLLSR